MGSFWLRLKRGFGLDTLGLWAQSRVQLEQNTASGTSACIVEIQGRSGVMLQFCVCEFGDTGPEILQHA